MSYTTLWTCDGCGKSIDEGKTFVTLSLKYDHPRMDFHDWKCVRVYVDKMVNEHEQVTI